MKKLNKKLIITIAILVVVAVCGVVVYFTQTTPELLVGGIFNGKTLKIVMEHSGEYAEYNIDNASAAEKEIAKNTSVIVSSMELITDNTGKITLRIVSPDIRDSIEDIANDISETEKDDFIDKLSEKLDDALEDGKVAKRSEPFYITAEMKFTGKTWIIVPNDELFAAITANFNALAEELFAAR